MAKKVLLQGACALISTVALLPTVPAVAQSAVADAHARKAEAPPPLTEVTVTAQRRSEKLRDVPVTVTAISSTQLRQANVRALTDLATVTPGLRFDYAGPNVQPTIRGIGTSFTTSGGIGDVGLYVDGFYNPNPLSADFQFLNVQNVQVLKGPQGTLFGRNTTGGAILVTTAKPSTTTSGTFEAAYGSFNDQRYAGYITTGITDNLAVDLEGLYHQGDGFQHNITTFQKNPGSFQDYTVRAGIKWDPTDWMSWLARYTHQDDNDPSALLANAYVKDGVPLTAALHPAIEALFGVPSVATAPNEIANNTKLGFRAKSDAWQLTGTFNLSFADLTSYTQYDRDHSYYHSDLDYSSTPLFNLGVPNVERTITQEVLLTSKPGGPLQWTAGFFYFDYLDSYPFTSFGIFGAPTTVQADSATTTSSEAAFVDATYEVYHNLFLTAGVRYSHDEVNDAFFSVLNPATGKLSRTNVPGLTANNFTPRAVIRYKPTNATSVYFSFTRGDKPGLLNVGGGQLQGIYVQPEKITAYEVGAKYGTPQLSIDLAAYYYDYSNLQTASYNGTQSLLTNAATARIYGVEGQADYHITQSLDVNGGLSINDAEYTSFNTAPFYDLSSPFLYNIGTRPGGASHQQLQRAPKVTGTAGASYGANLGPGRAVLSANLYYTSRFAFDPAGQFKQGAYSTLKMRLQYTPDRLPVTFAVFGDNITNTRYQTQILPSNFGIGSTWAYPATVGVSMRYHF